LIEYGQTDRFPQGSIVESTRWMVLHRPFEPAAQTGQVPGKPITLTFVEYFIRSFVQAASLLPYIVSTARCAQPLSRYTIRTLASLYR
jgi:hypothetical protein